jgi:four helix bundle protein
MLAWYVPCNCPGMDRGDLELRTQAFGVAVYTFCEALHQAPGARRLASQLVGCATSVGANYRSTSRARSRAEFVAKLGVVVEEADEAVYWLEVVEAARLGDRSTRVQLLTEAKELRAIVAAALRTARQNHRATSVRK